MSEDFPDVERIEINQEELDSFSTEDHFIEKSVDLLVETGSYVCVIGSMMPAEKGGWDADQAVMGGHLVRLFKLISAMLDQTRQHRRETAFMFARMAFECIVNLTFLIENFSAELISSYKSYSLQHEKALMDRIKGNISDRHGTVLPIEERMLSSIDKAFENSGMSPDQIQGREQRNWGGKSIYQKAHDVGLGDAYLAAIGGPSHGIHGNWHDLLEYQLDLEDGVFTPNFDWRHPRPQYLNVISVQTTVVLDRYLDWIDYDEVRHLHDNIADLRTRILRLDSAHEIWLRDA